MDENDSPGQLPDPSAFSKPGQIPDPSAYAYQPVDSAVPVRSHERHTEEMTFRASPRLKRAIERRATEEQTSVSELVRDALAARWGIK